MAADIWAARKLTEGKGLRAKNFRVAGSTGVIVLAPPGGKAAGGATLIIATNKKGGGTIEAKGGKPLANATGLPDAVQMLISADGKYLVVLFADGTLRKWDLETGKLLGTYTPPKGGN